MTLPPESHCSPQPPRPDLIHSSISLPTGKSMERNILPSTKNGHANANLWFLLGKSVNLKSANMVLQLPSSLLDWPVFWCRHMHWDKVYRGFVQGFHHGSQWGHVMPLPKSSSANSNRPRWRSKRSSSSRGISRSTSADTGTECECSTLVYFCSLVSLLFYLFVDFLCQYQHEYNLVLLLFLTCPYF